MEAFYYVLFTVLAATAAALELGKGGASRAAVSGGGGGGGGPAVTREFAAFRSNYVLVYALMMGALSRVFFVYAVERGRMHVWQALRRGGSRRAAPAGGSPKAFWFHYVRAPL